MRSKPRLSCRCETQFSGNTVAQDAVAPLQKASLEAVCIATPEPGPRSLG